MNFPDDLKYSADHEWVLVDGDIAIVGLTEHAQEEFTDITSIDLPELDKSFDQGDPVATVFSAKGENEVYAPISGEIIEVNEDLQDDASLINADPYGDGWIYKISINVEGELDNLMEAEDYEEFIA